MPNEHELGAAPGPAPAPGPAVAPLPAVAAPSHAERARTLLDGISTGVLCTLSRPIANGSDADISAGFPYGSLLPFALDEHRPIFLISELAEHTRNLRSDGRSSLLVSESRPGNALANGRATLLGICAPLNDARREIARAAYLGRHPEAAGYSSFGDFSFWALEVRSVRYIGGYGLMSWVSADEWASARPDPIAPHASAILEHMNQDHADALPVYVRAFSSVRELVSAEMTSIDRLGFELRVVATEGIRSVRVAFREPIVSTKDARTALVGLLKEARSKLGGT